MSTTAAVNCPSRSRAASSAGSSSTSLAPTPSDVQPATTACASALTPGLDATVGASTSRVNAAFPPGARHLPSTCFQPASVSEVLAAAASNGTLAADDASNAHEPGGTSES